MTYIFYSSKGHPLELGGLRFQALALVIILCCVFGASAYLPPMRLEVTSVWLIYHQCGNSNTPSRSGVTYGHVAGTWSIRERIERVLQGQYASWCTWSGYWFISLLQPERQLARAVHLMGHRKLRSFSPCFMKHEFKEATAYATCYGDKHLFPQQNFLSNIGAHSHEENCRCTIFPLHVSITNCPLVCEIPSEIFMVTTNIHFQNSLTYPW